MAEEYLGQARQGINLTPQPTPSEESLQFLEGFTPMVFGDKQELIRGNIPGHTLLEHWDLLNQHLALGNMTKEDIGTVYIMTKRNMLNAISNIPERKFTLAKMRELDRVKMSAYLLSTKSNQAGERDRRLIQSQITLAETKSHSREDIQQFQPGKKRSILNPLSWF